MAQGKLKVKTKKPAISQKSKNITRKKKPEKKGGHRIATPKRASEQEALRLQKAAQKSINQNIEKKLIQKVQQVEEGGNFKILQGSEKNGRKK